MASDKIVIRKSGLYALPLGGPKGKVWVANPNPAVLNKRIGAVATEADLELMLGISLPAAPKLKLFEVSTLPRDRKYLAADKPDMPKDMVFKPNYATTLCQNPFDGAPNIVASFEKPGIEKFIYAVVATVAPDGTPDRVQYDGYFHRAGDSSEVSPFYGTPGVVNVGLTRINKRLYFLAILQYRVTFIDPVTNTYRGQWQYGPSGGFGVKGVDPKDQAGRELREEGGVRVIKSVVELASSNIQDRALDTTGYKIFASTIGLTLPRGFDPHADEENFTIAGGFPILYPVDCFIPQADDINAKAIAAVRRHFRVNSLVY